MKGAIFGMLAVLALSACGSGNPQNNGTPAPANTGSPAKNEAPKANSEKTDPPKEDPDAFRKVSIPVPAGWHKVSKGEQKEFYKAKVLKDPGADFPMLAAYADKEPPHSSSGTDADWENWRDNTSLLMVFNVSKKKEDARAALKQYGEKFLPGFKADDVQTDGGFAVYAHEADPQAWMGGTGNARGTYVVVALIRSEDAGNKIVVYPNEIKAE